MSPSILDTIGNTPLVEIRKLNPNPNVKLFAKLEYFNPGGSIKDRPALYMIEAAEKSGELTHNKTILEATSGNTGIGLALVCGVKGYKLLLAMSESVSIERQKILRARGAEIMLTPGHLGTDGAIEEVYRLAREYPDRYYVVDQFNNEANWQAHYYGTAQEVWDQTDGNVTTLVACLGTTGTLMGASRRLKELNPEIQIIGVEPYLGHKIQGLKNMKEAYCPEIFQKQLLDEKVNIDDEEAFDMTRRLAKIEGLLVGMSSGAVMAVALEKVAQMTAGTVVVILPDGGERYLSTPLFAVRHEIGLTFFNTLSKTKEPFEPNIAGNVSIYSYGHAAHDRMHLGEMRRYVFADQLRRYLEYRGYRVQHIAAITDLDDKTIQASERAGLDLEAFVADQIEQFRKDLSVLNVSAAESYPQASEYIDDMVTLSQKLVSRGYAYEKLRSLYFDISRFSDYGQLSGIDINKIKLGATVDLDEYEKANPRDFTLFKRSKLSELKRGIFTKTDWGNVRPSWHIQCAAISMKFLGENYDMYASSRELLFPHHENVNAIAKAVTGKSLARYWIHCDRILIDGKKVDENDAGYNLDDLARMGYSGRLLRYWLFSTHYRKPIAFSENRLNEAMRSLKRLDHCIDTLQNIRDGFTSAMDDDLNISAAMAAMFKSIKTINRLADEKRINRGDASKILEVLRSIDSVLGFLNFEAVRYDAEIQRLIDARNKARSEKNWGDADQIREQLKSRGVVLQDQKIY
ncbi:MAG: cysteine synthase [Desulfobacterales bacterium]|jgi:cysteinyl-tRNA synthetase